MTNEPEPMSAELQRRLIEAEATLQARRDGRIDTLAGRHGTLVVRPAEVLARAEHIKQVLLAIRNVNQLIVSEDDPLRLIARACENLTGTLGYLNAWIALMDDAGRAVTETAASGFDGGFALMDAQLKAGVFTGCMKRSLAGEEVVVVESPKVACADCPLAAEYGGRAGLTRRLRHGGRTFGILSVSVPLAYAIDPEEQALFREMAEDLGFALHKISSYKQLLDSRAMLARTEAIARVGSWEWDVAGDRVRWSDALFGIFRRDPAAGAPPFAEHASLYVAEDMDRLRQAVQRCVADGAPYELELRAMRSDGEIRHCIARGYPETDARGRVCRLVGYLQDITEWRRAEAALRESDQRFRQIYEHMAVGVAIVSMAFRIERANKAYCQMLGYAEAELVGKHLREITQPEIVSENMRLQSQLATGEIDHYRMEKRFIHKSGGVVHGILDACLVRNADGNPDYFIGCVIDITDLKQTEAALIGSENRNRLLSELTMEGDLIHLNAVAIDFNPSMARMLGYDDRDELLNRNFMEFVHPEDLAIVRENIVKDYAAPYVIRMARRSGEYFFAEIESRNFIKGGDTWRVSAIRDITERKRAEQEREKLKEQLTQAQKMESVGRLAGGVAHDFNNMLGVILGHAEMAMDAVDPSQPIHMHLQEIYSAASRSAEITRQLLAFARKQTIAPQVLDLNETVEGMLKMLRRLIGEDIDLTWLPRCGACPVKMDPSQIDQILANLCVNARDAIAGVGRITIETDLKRFDPAYCASHAGFPPGDYVMLAVSDTGSGMDSEILGNLFEPFFTTKEVGKGTGLGLATVYGIVKQNNGFINVYSEPGQGTTFKIYLSYYAGGAGPDAVEAVAPPPRGRGETLLIVEDEGAILKLAKTLLEGLGYTALAAATPGEAIRLAETHAGRIHLLITDVVMPEMNGRDLARRLTWIRPGLKILFMSGYTANVIAHQGVLDSGVRFIHKPFSTRDIAIKVRQALDHPE